MTFDNHDIADMVVCQPDTYSAGNCKRDKCTGKLETTTWDQIDAGCVNSYYSTTCSKCDFHDTNDIFC